MSRIAIDGRALQDASSVRGIGSYLRGLLQGLNSVPHRHEIELLLRPAPSLPPEIDRLHLKVSPHRIPQISRRWQTVLDPWLVAGQLWRRKPDLYHAVEWAQPMVSRTPVVITVHDLTPFVFPQWFVWMRRKRLQSLWQLRFADAVITDSEATAADVERMAKVDRQKIHVVHLGIDPEFSPSGSERIAATLHRLQVERPYLLATSTFDPHKRLTLLLEVFAAIRRTHDVQLLIAGSQGGHLPAVKRAIAEAGLEAHVRLLGYLSKRDLIDVYSGARAFLHTSAYEGFGFPPLEAMACGTPAIAFANSSLPEVCGPSGLVEDGSAAAMAAAVARLLDDPQEYESRRRLGMVQASRFRWELTAQKTLEVYDRVLQRA